MTWAYLRVKTVLNKLLGHNVPQMQGGLPSSEMSEEDTLWSVANAFKDFLLDGKTDAKECLRNLYQNCLSNDNESEFHMVVWATSVQLQEEFQKNFDAANQGELRNPFLDRAELCIDLCDLIDVHAATYFLGNAFGRAANRAEVHPNPGSIH
jgi:hypothetical protein